MKDITPIWSRALEAKTGQQEATHTGLKVHRKVVMMEPYFRSSADILLERTRALNTARMNNNNNNTARTQQHRTSHENEQELATQIFLGNEPGKGGERHTL